MDFFVSVKSTKEMLESRWLEELSRASDVDSLLPLVCCEAETIANYRSRFNQFIKENGSGGLGVLQYLNLRLENEITNSIQKHSSKPKNFNVIISALDHSAFQQVNEGGLDEPILSISMGQQFNNFVKNITVSDAELLFLSEPAIHHWKQSLNGALVILREFCPDVLVELADRKLKIIPVTCSNLNMSISASNEFLSGVIVASWVPPKECAEMLVHEIGHSVLSDIISMTELWKDSQGELFYSPFRNDARPITGLFHAAYSFHNVCVYKSRLLNSTVSRLASWARRTLLSDYLRTLICVKILLQSDLLTEQGFVLAKKIERDLHDISGLIEFKQEDRSISMLQKHFAIWCDNHVSISLSSMKHFEEIINRTIKGCINSQSNDIWLDTKTYEQKKEISPNSQYIEFDSISDFWNSGFSSQVSVMRGLAPFIENSIKFDIGKHKDLEVRAIEKDSYKGNVTDPHCLMTLGEAFNSTTGKYLLILRNYERISSCVKELESFVFDKDFALGVCEHLLFCNCANVTVPLHKDSANNLHFVVSGKKTFFVASDGRDFSSLENSGYQDGFSKFNPFDKPNEALSLGEFVTLNSRDILFVPPERWHAVYYHEPSISVSIFDEITSSLAVTNFEKVAE